MERDITMTLEKIDFDPTDRVVEIIQNVKTILSTSKYTVPLDREFGLDPTIIDQPMPAAQAKLTAEIIATVHRYEPRCRVVRGFYDGNLDGRLAPTIRIRILEGVT
jgi:Phage baseplate assembly protein W